MTMVVSADEHVVEPFEFWQDWLPTSLSPSDRTRAPQRIGGAVSLDGRTPMRTFVLFPELVAKSDQAAGASDVADRLAVMDDEGIGVSVVYPQRAMSILGVDDRALMRECFDAYNTWLASWCAASNGRLLGVPILPTFYQPETTADYIERLRGLGFRTFMLPNYPRDVRYGDDAMRPMWEAIEASGLPLNFHISEAPDDNGNGGLGTYLMQSFQPFRKIWSYLVFSGVFARHPGLRVVFAEGGISWVPSVLDHADRVHRESADHLVPKLPEPPSEYWRRQCWATFMDDPRGVEQIQHIGVDRVLWSSDYPHPEGTRGATEAVWASVRAEVGDAAAERILGANAAEVYGL